MRSNRLVSILLLAVAVAAITGCRDQSFHNIYDTSQEQAIGNEEADEIKSSVKFDSDAADNTRIQRIAQPIFDQARKMRPEVPYTIHIIDSPEINAFSIPGGYVYIYTGLLNKLGNDDDAVAAVIGHESAHVVRRHAVKQMSDAGLKGDLVEILGIATQNANAYNAATIAYQLEQLHYSREDEYEADKYGLMFSYNAGFDPNGMLRTFKKLEEADTSGGGEPPYAEDHPITQNRELRVQQLIQTLRANDGHYPTDTGVAPTTASTTTPTNNSAAKTY